MTNRRLIVAILFLAAIVFFIAAMAHGEKAKAQTTSKPNIVYIVTDDMKKSDLEDMPFTKSLVFDQGITYNQAMVTTSQCCPSRAAMLTGKYDHNNGVKSNKAPGGGYSSFSDHGNKDKTVAVWLDNAGYNTTIIGKYLNGAGCDSSNPGWDEWYGRGGVAYYDYCLGKDKYGSKDSDYITDVINSKAVDFINRQDSTTPFFAYLAPTAPHGPATPAPRHKDLFAGQSAPRSPSYNEEDVSDKPNWIQSKNRIGNDAEKSIDNTYQKRVESLQSVDEMVRDVYNALDANGQLDNTYIVFTSDNGWHYGEHRIREGKNSYYEPSIIMPLGIRGPGIASGTTSNDLVANIDFAPTFADLAGATPNTEVDGRSIVPTFSGSAPNWRKQVLEEFWDTDYVPAHKSLRGTNWKFSKLSNNSGFEEYYDLASDPDEMDNLLKTSSTPPDVTAKRQLLNDLYNCAGQQCRDLEDSAS